MHPDGSDRSFADLGLAEILQKHDWLQFDVEEFFLSLRYRAHLSDMMSEFKSAMQAPARAWPVEDRINSSVGLGKLSEIPAFRDVAALRSLQQFPETTKDDLRAFADRYMDPRLANELLWKKLTTGSSGTPLQIWYSSAFYYDLLFLAPRKILNRAIVSELPSRRLFCLSVSDNQSMPDMAFIDPTQDAGISIQVVVDGGRPETLDRMLGMVREYEPVCIASKPSLLEIMVRHIGKSERYGPMDCHIISSGSAMTSELRASLFAITKGSVIDAYAMTEFGLIASECRCGQLHIDTSAVFVEVLDEEGRAVPDGVVGELVLSSDRNAAMPLMRYRTGDLGSLTFEECQCGERTPRIGTLDGRMIRCFRLANGELFPPTRFNDMFARFPDLREFQMTELDVGNFQVDAELCLDAADPDDTLSRIRAHVFQAIPGCSAVRVKRASFIFDSKFQRYRTNV